MKRILFLILALVPVMASFAAKDSERGVASGPDLFVTCELDRRNVYERQSVTARLLLYSSTPDIAFADIAIAPKLNRGEFNSLQMTNIQEAASQEEIEGKLFYCFPLREFVFTMSEKGKYQLDGGECRIGVSRPVVVNDPFWGRIRTSEVEEINVPIRKAEFKVKALPVPPADSNFSGSVGTFTIKTVIPRGDIIVGEEATAIIVLSGNGMIADSVLPEYRGAFKNGVKLKSVSESRSDSYRNGKLFSELQLECSFIPTERSGAEIGEVSFDFFNPDTGKFETIRSAPVKIEVKSSTTKRESISV